tara:strand:+ start:329 stop:640 length:312 start_codon:yes stop_codon:yes gene_type:complete
MERERSKWMQKLIWDNGNCFEKTIIKLIENHKKFTGQIQQHLNDKIGEIDIGYTDREDLEIDISMDSELDKVYRLGYLDALIEVKSELEMDLEIQKINNYGKK